MSDVPAFGQWIRYRRKALDLTQEALAERMHCGFETVRKLETGSRKPSRQMAKLLASALELPADQVESFIEFARSGMAPDLLIEQKAVGASRLTSVNLPAPRTTFIGRVQEVEQVGALLASADVRLLTLLGPPGIGKTRLALEAVAHAGHYADGVFFIDLSPLLDYELVPSTIARAIGLKEGADRAPREALHEYLRSREILLLLDNFEHLLAAAEFIAALIADSHGLKVLVTSRAVLAISSEQQFSVPTLRVPPSAAMPFDQLVQYEAVQLFVQRAKAAKPLFALTEKTAPVVAEITRQLDGLALAIELAAARIRVLTPQELLARLTSRLRLLTVGPTDLPPRQRSLRAAIAGSYEPLDPSAQVLFRRMTVFVGGAQLDAVAAVTILPEEPQREAVEGVSLLLDRSLLNADETESGELRFSMLWTIREYGQERLDEAGEGNAIRHRHADYYLQLAESAEPFLTSAARDTWLDRLEREHDNLSAALTWYLGAAAQAQQALRLAAALHWFWYFRGYLTEGREWLSKALALADKDERTAARAKALSAAGRLAYLQDDYAPMLDYPQESVSIWRELDDKRGLAYALANLGLALVYRHRDTTGDGHLLVEEAVALFGAIEDRWGLAFSLDLLGDVAILLARPEEDFARRKAESLAIYQELADQWGIANQLSQLGHSAVRRGEFEQAKSYFERALQLEQTVQDRWVIAHSLRSLGDIAWYQGEYQRSADLFNRSLSLYRQLGDKLRTAAALRNLGLLATDGGDYEGAEVLHKQSLTILHRLANQQTSALCIAGLAGVAAGRGHWLRAARLLATTDVLREASHGLMPPFDSVMYNRCLGLVRNMLETVTLEQVWQQARQLNFEQMVAHAQVEDVELWLAQ